jgi:hypothetical protein
LGTVGSLLTDLGDVFSGFLAWHTVLAAGSSRFLQFLQSLRIFLGKVTNSIFCSSGSYYFSSFWRRWRTISSRGAVFHGQRWLVARGVPYRFA